jgi:hypothetical protein
MRGQLVKLDNEIIVRYYSVSKKETEEYKLHQSECDILNNELPENTDITFYVVLESDNKTYAKLVHQIDLSPYSKQQTWEDIEEAYKSQTRLNSFEWLKQYYKVPLKK